MLFIQPFTRIDNPGIIYHSTVGLIDTNSPDAGEWNLSLVNPFIHWSNQFELDKVYIKPIPGFFGIQYWIGKKFRVKKKVKEGNPWPYSCLMVRVQLAEAEITELHTLMEANGAGDAGTILPPQSLFGKITFPRLLIPKWASPIAPPKMKSRKQSFLVLNSRRIAEENTPNLSLT